MNTTSGLRLEKEFRDRGYYYASFHEATRCLYLNDLSNSVCIRIHTVYMAETLLQPSNEHQHKPTVFQFPEHVRNWQDQTVINLANQCKDDLQAFPILADALEDAGADEDAVAHCRDNPGLDSWVLDVLTNPLYQMTKEQLCDFGYRMHQPADLARAVYLLKHHYQMDIAQQCQVSKVVNSTYLQNHFDLMDLPRQLWIRFMKGKMACALAVAYLHDCQRWNRIKSNRIEVTK